MTLPIYRSTDPLFTIISRDPDARSKFTKWTGTSRSIQARVEENRLFLYDHNTLCLFITGWPHGFDTVMIWDTLLKRHIYL